MKSATGSQWAAGRWRRPRSGADDHRLGHWRVDHPLVAELGPQAVGRQEHAALLADVLAEHDDALVAPHLVGKGVADRLDEGLRGTPRPARARRRGRRRSRSPTAGPPRTASARRRPSPSRSSGPGRAAPRRRAVASSTAAWISSESRTSTSSVRIPASRNWSRKRGADRLFSAPFPPAGTSPVVGHSGQAAPCSISAGRSTRCAIHGCLGCGCSQSAPGNRQRRRRGCCRRRVPDAGPATWRAIGTLIARVSSTNTNGNLWIVAKFALVHVALVRGPRHDRHGDLVRPADLGGQRDADGMELRTTGDDITRLCSCERSGRASGPADEDPTRWRTGPSGCPGRSSRT